MVLTLCKMELTLQQPGCGEITLSGPVLGTQWVNRESSDLPFRVPHSYQRKLRAMKAAKEARKTAVGVMPPGSAIPGTNVYNTER